MNESFIKKPIIFILVGLFVFICSFNIHSASLDINTWLENESNYKIYNWLYDRSLAVNKWYIYWRSELGQKDYMTESQAETRVKAIIKYAYELNYIYPSINPRRIFKDFYTVIEYESHFVNYKNQDDGKSFGVCALTWQVAQMASDYFNDNLCLYKSKIENEKKKIYYNKSHRNLLRKDTDKQIKYGIWYYYYLLKKYYNGDRLLALTGYNAGTGLDSDLPRFRNYYFTIRGRLEYFEDEFKKLNSK